MVIALLFGLSLLPKQARAIPDSIIYLDNAQVVLYPQEDPEAVWYFFSDTVEYNPDLRETTLYNIEEGKRTVNSKTDFTLSSEQVIISSDDNLRGEQLLAHILEDDIFLDMRSQQGRQVLINQREGQFEIPHLEMTQEGDFSVFENVRTGFDLASFEAGGAGTVGYNQFAIQGKED